MTTLDDRKPSSREPTLADVSGPSRLAEPDEAISAEELQLAARNHGIPLEALRYDVTPAGLHYLLIHYDIPELDPATHTLTIGGAVDRPLTVTLADLRERQRVTRQVTLECAGNGRALLHPRPVSQPWLVEAVGNAEWTGTPSHRCCGRRASTRTRWTWSSPAPITVWSVGSSRTTSGRFRSPTRSARRCCWRTR